MTPADLARTRELHAAMVKGSAREGDVAELLRLLPAVFEAAARSERDTEKRIAEAIEHERRWADFKPGDMK